MGKYYTIGLWSTLYILGLNDNLKKIPLLSIQSPSTLGEEKTYNPFLRTSDDSILRMVDSDPESASDKGALRAQALAYLRKCKDNFKYKL